MSAYPPQPWHLTAHAFVGTALVPIDLLPQLPPGCRAITFRGKAIVGVAYFVYEEPSPLTYNEIMATVLVRKGWRLYVHITQIWVDSPASRDGGRALWAIPKDLADFDVVPDSSYDASFEGAEIGSLTVERSRSLPVALPIGFMIAQERDGGVLRTKVRGRGRVGKAKGRWTFNPDGPPGFLAGHEPFLTLSLKKLRIVFGS